MTLAALLVLQWILFSMVLSHRHDPTNNSIAPETMRSRTSLEQQQQLQVLPPLAGPIPRSPSSPTLEGVALTLMLKAPKWFHRRYTVMLHNALANIPNDTWRVQVFMNAAWLEKDVLPLHPGLRSMYHPRHEEEEERQKKEEDGSSWTVGRVIWTPLPTNMTRLKPKEIMKSTWLWENVGAENVLLFGGNGALCANTQSSLNEFLEWDYVGVPWSQFHGQGGDGSTHSFRHRSAMLSILTRNPPNGDDRPDYQFFIEHMLKESSTFKVADRQTTMAFGGVRELDHAPLLLSGTQATLNWTRRENVLMTCPEIKVIFPSMHEPSCFGAHPNGAKCKESICALQDQLPPQGC